MYPYKRAVRVGDLIKEEIADIIMNKLRDPRLGFITVTGTKVSDDLRNATVYVSVLEEAKRDETLKILNSSASFIRSELVRRVRMKFVPALSFRIDESIEYSLKIEKLLDEIRSKKGGAE